MAPVRPGRWPPYFLLKKNILTLLVEDRVLRGHPAMPVRKRPDMPSATPTASSINTARRLRQLLLDGLELGADGAERRVSL